MNIQQIIKLLQKKRTNFHGGREEKIITPLAKARSMSDQARTNQREQGGWLRDPKRHYVGFRREVHGEKEKTWSLGSWAKTGGRAWGEGQKGNTRKSRAGTDIFPWKERGVVGSCRGK